MLESLHLENVGPAPEMALELAPRLNLLTGDNGLGKSFLLDVAWWALTRKWPREINRSLTSGYPARPRQRGKPAWIEFRVKAKSRRVTYRSSYLPREEAWTGKSGRPWNPGLVVYAHADGGFSVWDPARNYWRKKGDIDVQDRLPGYVFTPQEVWDGLSVERAGTTSVVCNGLIRDWASWIREEGSDANDMAQRLERLSISSDPQEALRPGPLLRISVDDARDIPSLLTAHAGAIPVLHASAGVRRILALAYMLLWSWREHDLTARFLGEEPTRQVVLLVDEIESHLHPKWQRSILDAVLSFAKVLDAEATVQLLAATHSPLVLASVEPWFDPDRDAWFDLDLKGGQVQLTRRDFVRHGDASNWLTSEAFNLKSARSREAEEVLERAAVALSDEGFDRRVAKRLDKDLRKVLGDTDPFWARWRYVGEKRGWLP